MPMRDEVSERTLFACSDFLIRITGVNLIIYSTSHIAIRRDMLMSGEGYLRVAQKNTGVFIKGYLVEPFRYPLTFYGCYDIINMFVG